MERAAFYAAWREKKLRGLFLTAVGNSGNAARRVQEFIQSKGSYAYGGYPDIDDMFQQQARERDPKKREALLHRIQQLTVDRVMFAPVMDLRALMGGGSTNRRTHDHVGRDESLPVLGGPETQGETTLRFGSLDHIEPVPTASPQCQERGLNVIAHPTRE